MAEITVDIEVPGGLRLEGTVIPDDYQVNEVISELIDELNLPRLNDDGQGISYSVYHVNNNTTLNGEDTLPKAGVKQGDTLQLVTTAEVQPYDLGRFEVADTSEHDSSSIEVILSVLDLNKSERIRLQLDSIVGDIIPNIALNYHLPSRDKINQPITYRIESKALGRYLSNFETLRDARIPRLDRLSLHREEVAGATT